MLINDGNKKNFNFYRNLVPIFYGCLMRTLYTDTVSYLDNDANRNLNKFSVIKEMVKLLRLISNVLKKEENRRFLDIYFKVFLKI